MSMKQTFISYFVWTTQWKIMWKWQKFLVRNRPLGFIKLKKPIRALPYFFFFLLFTNSPTLYIGFNTKLIFLILLSVLYPDTPDDLVSCNSCGRTFLPSTLVSGFTSFKGPLTCKQFFYAKWLCWCVRVFTSQNHYLLDSNVYHIIIIIFSCIFLRSAKPRF